jgi:hypothetical protein
MATTQVEPYIANASATFSFANVTITNAIQANNTAGTTSVGTTTQVLTSTGTKTIWENTISPFMLMGA